MARFGLVAGDPHVQSAFGTIINSGRPWSLHAFMLSVNRESRKTRLNVRGFGDYIHSAEDK
jgi:hypothetical protein